MPITIYPGTVKKRNANGTYSDLVPGVDVPVSEIEELQNIVGDGQLSGFTATDLTGAANELKITLNIKYEKPSNGIPASDLASGVIPTVPSAYTSNPVMDGTASAGSSGSWAKGDHVHPTDTSRQAKITASGILKGNGSGGISAATAGTDYGTYSKPSGGIPDSDIASASTWNSSANAINEVEKGIAIIVNGDTCSKAVPAGGYAYIKNNTHGLTEGLYKNKSSSSFPKSGGTANSSVFTAVIDGGLNNVYNKVLDEISSRLIPDSAAIDVHNLSSATTYSVSSGYRGVFWIIDSNAAKCGMYFLWSYTSGGVDIKAISAASNITINTSTANKITFTPDSGSRQLLFISANGMHI